MNRPLALCTALTLAGLLLGAPSPVLAEEGRVRAALSGVDPARIAENLRSLTALPCRFAGGGGAEGGARWVQQRLVALGLSARLEAVPLAPRPVSNVVVDLPGSRPDLPPLLLSAHHDAIAFVPGTLELATPCPGAEDNGSGVVALLELARAFSAARPGRPVRLAFFGAEEVGLVGSRTMAAGLVQGGGQRPLAVINLDMVGYDPAGKRRLILDGYPTGRGLAARLAEAAQDFTSLTPLGGIFSAGRSDHHPFALIGLPAVTLASASWQDYPHYHTPQDTPDRVDPTMVAEVVRAALATALGLCGFADGPPVAHGGAFVAGEVGRTAWLDGGASFDPGGRPLTYRWTQQGGPPVTLRGEGVRVAFEPPGEGIYRFSLVVEADDGRRSAPDLAAVLVSESPGCRAAAGAGSRDIFTSILIAGLLAVFAWVRRRR